MIIIKFKIMLQNVFNFIFKHFLCHFLFVVIFLFSIFSFHKFLAVFFSRHFFCSCSSPSAHETEIRPMCSQTLFCPKSRIIFSTETEVFNTRGFLLLCIKMELTWFVSRSGKGGYKREKMVKLLKCVFVLLYYL